MADQAAADVRLYDFRRPTALVREHARALEVAFDTFARQWGTQLTAKVRVLSRVTFVDVRMLGYDEYAVGLPATTAMILCAVPDTQPRAVIQFPTSAALQWVNAMLGGTQPVTVPERAFTPIEYALVRQLMGDALEDLKYSLGPLLPDDIDVGGIQYHSQFAQAAPTAELMIVARFLIAVGDNRSDASVAIPARLILPQLGEISPTVPSDDAAAYLRAQLVQVPIDVAAQFTVSHVRPRVVLEMRVGDLIPISHPVHRPLEVTVGDQRIASAAIGASGSRLAIVITDSEEGTS